MKKNILILLFGFYVISITANNLFLSPDWKFSTGDDIAWASLDFIDSDWDVISSRSYWEEQGYENYDGYAWYRQQVHIPAKWKKAAIQNGGLYIKYDYADDVDEVYVNGVWIGRMGEFPPRLKINFSAGRKFFIPYELINFGKKNLIAIRLYDNGGGGGLFTKNVELSVVAPMDGLSLLLEDKNLVYRKNADTISFTIAQQAPFINKTEFNLICKITTDDFLPVDSLAFPLTWRPSQENNKTISFVPPHPGFYRITVWGEQKGAKSDLLKFNVGYDVDNIEYIVDAKEDFNQFWKQTLNELQHVEPRFNMTLMAGSSIGAKNTYHVEMYSLGNVKIEGYYTVPKEGNGNYPVIISFLGYGASSTPPKPDNLPGFCEFVLSTRGQGIQKEQNIYDQCVVYGIESKETYYYRGAYMDLIRGVDFLCARSEVDTTLIFAEGGSQGGAFTMAACALDNRIKAAAFYNPFLSDFRNYFNIAPWPRDLFTMYLRKHKDKSWDDVFDVLSYFDIKNLASKITCPVIMGVGLQDNVCPPRINFAGYSRITSPKVYYIYSDQGHTVGKNWWGIRDDFFRGFLNEK